MWELGRAGTESASARLCLGAAGSPSAFAASGSPQRFLRLGAPPWSEPVSWPKGTGRAIVSVAMPLGLSSTE